MKENQGYMAMLNVLNNPVLSLPLGKLMGRIVKECVREVSLAQVSCILIYVYVALPTLVGAWSMALGLRQRIEYYDYIIVPSKFHVANNLVVSHKVQWRLT